MDKNKLTILLIGFIDILGIGIFIPTLPDLTEYYNVSAHSISYAIVLYALFSFLFGPILGQLSDRFGRKKILLLCVIGSFFSSLLMSISTVFLIFLLGRVINGITGGNISILYSMMSDISKNKNERTQNMGLVGGLFGLGFIVGPVIGALLLPFGVKSPFWFMTLLSIVEMVVLVIFLQETNKHINIKKINANPFSLIIKYLNDKTVHLFLISFFVLTLSFSLYQGMFPVFLTKEFGLPGYAAGYVMSGVGLFIAINQAFLLKRFWLKYFSLKKLFLITNIGLFLIFIMLSFISYFPLFLCVFYCLVFFQGTINPIYSSEIIETSEKENRGEIMGVLSSLQSVSMFIGPLVGGILIDRDISIFIAGGGIVFINLLILIKLIGVIQENEEETV